MSLDKYIENADRRFYSLLGRSWLWRFSRFVVGVVPPIGALIMLLHCCVLLSGGKLWMTEWVFDCSLLGAVAWLSLSFAMGFCWVHRAFITYGVLISACIDFQRCFGFGVLLTPMRTLMVCLGVLLFAFFIRRKAWHEFYKRQNKLLMKRIFFATCVFLLSCVCFSQTVVSRWQKIKNTRIEWSVVGSDTVYVLPVTDFSSPLTDTIVLSFHGSSALMSTLQWLSTAELPNGDLFRLDNADDKNVVARASDGFASGFLLYNKGGHLPATVFWMKRFVRDDYKRCLKYFSNGVQKEKAKSNDDVYK